MFVCQVRGCFLSFSYCLVHVNSAFKTTLCGETRGVR